MWPSEVFYQIFISELFQDLSVDRALETSWRPSLGSTHTASRHTWFQVFFGKLVFALIGVFCSKPLALHLSGLVTQFW